jgi:hypothetical protein
LLSRRAKDGKLWDKDEEGKISEQIYDIPSIHEERLTIDKAFLKDNQGLDITNYRQRPEVGRVSQSLYPYEIAANYLRDFNLWNIEEQNFSLLHHNTVVLSEKLQEETSRKQNADTFKFWVDKDTGILIKYESYNNSGHIGTIFQQKNFM